MRASRTASSLAPWAHFSRMDCSRMDSGVSSSLEDIDQADTANNKKRGRKPTPSPASCLSLYNFLGHLGKVNFPSAGRRLPRLRMRGCSGLLSITVALAACGIQELPSRLSREVGTGKVYALHGLEGRWSGTVRSDDPFCGSSMGLMTIRGDKFAFDPFQSTTVIQGTISKLGRVQGNLSSTGGNKMPGYASFDGSAKTDDAAEQSIAIIGTLRSDTCHWAVRLQRS